MSYLFDKDFISKKGIMKTKLEPNVISTEERIMYIINIDSAG